MTDSSYGFLFEQIGRGGDDGPISPDEEYFKGSHAAEALVRETGQNSLDHRLGDGPVTMVFELAYMATGDIPGITGLRQHMEWAKDAWSGQEGHDGLVAAWEAASGDEIAVLRISDYGTTGLKGSEDIRELKTGMTALTRGTGISADDGSRGGSFGIGSAVGTEASELRTVLYTTKREEEEAVVFAATSRLGTHYDDDDVKRSKVGFFTDIELKDNFRYLRDPGPIGPFPMRTELGLDTYVLGYPHANADPLLHDIRLAFLRNFLPAIHRGRLVVIGRAGGEEWVLDASTLASHAKSSEDTLAFYRALLDPEPIVRESALLGELRLYINVDDTLEKTLHTVTCRSPLMKIDTFKHTSIPIKYAAILECSDPRANTKLRKLEPPQHHRWDAKRAAYGDAVVKELKTFVREGLRTRVREQVGESVEVKGLARFLPADDLESAAMASGEGRAPGSDDGSQEESATVQGRAGQSLPVFNGRRKSVPVSVKTPASSGGQEDSSKGKDTGGSGKRGSAGGDLGGKGHEGPGTSRIKGGDVRLRTWTDSATGQLVVAVTAAKNVKGDLELVALGAGGRTEDDYDLPFSVAFEDVGGSRVAIEHEGNAFKGLTLEAGTTRIIRVDLSAPHRYRLGVK